MYCTTFMSLVIILCANAWFFIQLENELVGCISFEVVVRSAVKTLIFVRCQFAIHETETNQRLVSIKMSSYQYKNSHHKDKMVSRPSYLYNGNTYTWRDHLYIETGLRGRPSERCHSPDNGPVPVCMNQSFFFSAPILHPKQMATTVLMLVERYEGNKLFVFSMIPCLFTRQQYMHIECCINITWHISSTPFKASNWCRLLNTFQNEVKFCRPFEHCQ